MRIATAPMGPRNDHRGRYAARLFFYPSRLWPHSGQNLLEQNITCISTEGVGTEFIFSLEPASEEI